MSSGLAAAALALAPHARAHPDPAEIIRSSVANNEANRQKASPYAYRERRVDYEIEKDRIKRERGSETWEVIGLEGSTYRKLVARDDKPLPTKEQKHEDERLAKEAELRRKETPEQRRNRTLSFSLQLHLSPSEMLRLYDLAYLREEPVNGRAAHVIEGVPKTGLRDLSSNDKELLHYRVHMWVDREDLQPVRSRLEVIADGSRMRKGSVLVSRMFRNLDGVWLMGEARFLYHARFFKMLNFHGEMLVTYSNYQKFDVESRVVEVADAP